MIEGKLNLNIFDSTSTHVSNYQLIIKKRIDISSLFNSIAWRNLKALNYFNQKMRSNKLTNYESRYI